MMHFIAEAIGYLDPYQPRALAHTCRSAHDQARERMLSGAFVCTHASVRPVDDDDDPEPITYNIKLAPVDSMLARSSLTSLAGAIDKTRAHLCHPAIVSWFDTLWRYHNDRTLQKEFLIQSVCRYDDVEFARTLFQYIISIAPHDFVLANSMPEHPWFIALEASIPPGPEIARVTCTSARNTTNSARLFAFLMSRDIIDLLMIGVEYEPYDMCAHVLAKAIIANNEQLARAIMDTRTHTMSSQQKDDGCTTITAHWDIVTPSAIRFCKNNNIIIYGPHIRLDREALDALLHGRASPDADTSMMDGALTLIALDLRDPDLLRAVALASDAMNFVALYTDITYTCCCANRMDIVDAFIEAGKYSNIRQNIVREYVFNPIALARLCELASNHMYDKGMVCRVVKFVRENSHTDEQIRAFLSPNAVQSSARAESPIYSYANLISDEEQIPGMRNIYQPKSLPSQWCIVIHAIMHARDIDKIMRAPMSTSYINFEAVYDGVAYYRSLQLPRDVSQYRAAVQKVIPYLISNMRGNKSRNMFMLGMVLDSRDAMLKSKYRLRMQDCDYSIRAAANTYMRSNQSISEFFAPSERLECYVSMINITNHFCQTLLLRELHDSELFMISTHLFDRFDEVRFDSIELISKALLRMRKGPIDRASIE